MPYDENWTWYPDPEPDESEQYNSYCQCARMEWEEEQHRRDDEDDGPWWEHLEPPEHICNVVNCDNCPDKFCKYNKKENENE